jgi:hypothetical protein
MREEHPAAGVVDAFLAMRERCKHYRGVKERSDRPQCTHRDADRMSSYCAMDCCPLLQERARAESVGWD